MSNHGSAQHRTLDNTIEIVTPENIAFHYRVAGPFRRLPAFAIDLALRGFILLALVLAFSPAMPFLGGMWFAVIVIIYYLLDWFYGALFETYWNGQTPGKRALGLRVLTDEGHPINGLQAVVRNFLRFADLMPLVSLEAFGAPTPVYMIPTGMIGLCACALNRRYQRLGDLVSGTIVVVEERQWLMGVARLEDPRTAQLAELLPADFAVTRTLARALATYVERRRYFSNSRRREVARHLAEPLIADFGLPADTSYDLLLCALYYRTFVAERGQEQPGRESAADPTSAVDSTGSVDPTGAAGRMATTAGVAAAGSQAGRQPAAPGR